MRQRIVVLDESQVIADGPAPEVLTDPILIERKIGEGGVGPITARLQKHFADVVRGRVPQRKGWLTPVWT